MIDQLGFSAGSPAFICVRPMLPEGPLPVDFVMDPASSAPRRAF